MVEYGFLWFGARHWTNWWKFHIYSGNPYYIEFSNESEGDIDPLLLDGNDAGDNDDVNDGVRDCVDDNANETNDDTISISSEQSDDNMSISSDASLATTMPWEDYVQEYLEQLVEDIEE